MRYLLLLLLLLARPALAQNEWVYVGSAKVNEIQPSLGWDLLRMEMRGVTQAELDAATHIEISNGIFVTSRFAVSSGPDKVLYAENAKVGPPRGLGSVTVDSLRYAPDIRYKPTFTDIADSAAVGLLPLFGGDSVWEPSDNNGNGQVEAADLITAAYSRDSGDTISVVLGDSLYHTDADSVIFTRGLFPSVNVALWTLRDRCP